MGDPMAPRGLSMQLASRGALGLRFWDPIYHQQVDGLQVSFWRADAPEPRRPLPAIRTPDGLYTLPGGLSRSERERWILEALDPQGRFLPFAARVAGVAPGEYRRLSGQDLGQAPWPRPPGAVGPASPPPQTVALFSAPTRPLPPGWAVLTGLFRTRDRAPVRFARAHLLLGPNLAGHGQTDERGVLTLLFRPPQVGAGIALQREPPPAVLQLFFRPGIAPLPGGNAPDQASVWAQPAARIYPSSPDPESPEGSEPTPVLDWRLELSSKPVQSLATTGLEYVLVEPVPSDSADF